jgi:hypothetical protein
MDLDSQLDKLIENIIKRYVDTKVKEAFDLVLKLLGNILRNPTEQKFRIFKKTNEVIKTKVLIMKEFLQLMILLGYSDLDAECMIFLEESDFSKIKKGIEVINKYQKGLNAKVKDLEKLEELKHQDEIKRNNEDIKRKFLEEKEKQNKILEQMKFDKEERKKMDKPVDSVGKQLTFGANVCKFEPKNSGGGGG